MRAQILEIRNKRREVVTETIEIQGIIRDYYMPTVTCQQIGKPRKIDKFLETHNLLTLNHEEIEDLNRSIIMKLSQ